MSESLFERIIFNLGCNTYTDKQYARKIKVSDSNPAASYVQR